MWSEIKASPVAVADMLDDLEHGNKFYTGVETDKGVLLFSRNYEGNHQYGAFMEANIERRFFEPDFEGKPLTVYELRGWPSLMAGKINRCYDDYDAPYKLRSDVILTFKQKRTVIRQLKKQPIATRNLKGSMEALPFFDAKCKKAIEKTIAFLEKQIKNLEEELAVLAQSEYKKQMDLLTSVKGIGVTLAAALIMTTGGFTYFDNAKQLTRYLGLSPTYQQSGTSVNVKGHINRNGDSSLRGLLYIAAMASLRCNTECKECFDRLRSNGKPGKVAVVAVANKLVRQAFAVVTQEKTYVDGFKSAKP